MDRGNIGRLLLIVAGVFLAFQLVPGLFGGSHGGQGRPDKGHEWLLKPEGTKTAGARAPERLCSIYTPEFHAVLSTQSATLRRFDLTKAKYTKHGKPIALSTTEPLEERRQLRFNYRNQAAGVKEDDWLVGADFLDYELVSSTKTSCEFSYRDERVEIREIVSSTGRPYELEVKTTLTNLAPRSLFHATTVHTDAFRTHKEVKPGWLRQSYLATHVECLTIDDKAKRMRPEDFSADKFKSFRRSGTNLGDWADAAEGPATPALAAVSNAYFSQALVPLAAPTAPECQLQVEDRWDDRRYSGLDADPNGGSIYRARLAYPKHELKPGEKDEFRLLTYVGPKERSTLEAAAGGNHRLIDLIDLGFFSVIAKVLVAFLLKVHSVVPNWGIAIIVLTITARTLLFPLTLPSVKSMIKMRELKPEMDALNEKFKDDAQAKGLAQMELWRKHNVNPLKGCLPQLASMPVWFALYTTLQTAVELFNIPFLWFPDLSDKDPLYILPFVIGGTSFMQQRLMPMQGDPAQQKMMLYFMPAMFIFMMLFLPSGLGVYMFTNGLLGIIQQQLVERHAKRSLAKSKASGIQVEVVEDKKTKPKAELKAKPRPDSNGKGKSRESQP
jgi:YidC/Oxa1 family membrane protein insertase